MAILDDFTVGSTGDIRYVGSLHGVGANTGWTGAISTTTLTISGSGTGGWQVGQMVTGTGILPGTRITALVSGTGGTGTYTINNSHGTVTATAVVGHSSNYYTVIAFHRWLMDLADNQSAAISTASSADYLDITDKTPSERSTDNIITLLNSFNIDQNAAEHLYDGSIIQSGGAEIWDGLVVIANQGMKFDLVQNGKVLTNNYWNFRVKGRHNGGANAASLSDTTKVWTTNQWAGYYIENTTDGSWGVITANTATAITATLQGGTENDWDVGDNYQIIAGMNSDSISGYSHRFMVKVRSSLNDNDGVSFTNADGSTTGDIDGKRLLGQTRVWLKTYGEFRIGTGTARGNNVMALTYADDLNNTSAKAIVGTNWTTITNLTAGYNAMDVDNNTTNEFYYSKWDVPAQVDRGSGLVTAKINDLYERIKWITTTGTSTSLYGLNGALFRGITHEITYTTATGAGAWTQGATLSWGTGVTAGVGQLIAASASGTGAGTLWIQYVSGVAPVGAISLTQTASSKTITTVLVTERTLSFPHCGASTGSALIGAYGFGVNNADLTAADKVTDLTATVITPPDNRSFAVTGLNTNDYVLVGPESAGTILLRQFNLSTALTTDNVTTVVIKTNGLGGPATIPADTPASGTIRVKDNLGNYRRLTYSSWAGSTFTLNVGAYDGNEDFATTNASVDNEVFISYLDTTGVTSASYTAVYSTPRSLFVRVRFAGTGGSSYTDSIKTFESPASFPGSSAAIRTPDA